MNYRASTRQIVGSAARWSRNKDSVSLHYSKESVVDVDVKAAHRLAIASNADLIECETDCWLYQRGRLAINKHLFVKRRVHD